MIGGFFKFHWVDPQLITVKIDDPKSPLTAMFHGQEFEIHDETYTFGMDTWSRENLHVLTSIDYAKMSDADKAKEANPRADHDYGLSWIKRDGKGRVFYEAHGHNERIYAITAAARARARRHAVRHRRPEGGRHAERQSRNQIAMTQARATLPALGVAAIIMAVAGASDIRGERGAAAALSTPIKVEGGLVSGVPGRNPSLTVFKGIPFAAPPVGPRRWRAPQPPAALARASARRTPSPPAASSRSSPSASPGPTSS